MEDAVAARHRELRPLFEETVLALETGDPSRASRVFARLRGELEAHFEQEDRLYYSVIGALRPDHRDALEGFATAHDRFRQRFLEIAERLEANDAAAARAGFDAFAEALARHEVGEEDLLRALDIALGVA